ncbi:hypothetical protein BC628DRAFT_1436598 [Trametes gibbosa]|nr:hypothetical protein BC628DRAFT_1436598 [Trametes gibbosa]
MSSPLAHHTYFRSPIATILSSLNSTSDYITIYDLVDAYNTFSRRITAASTLLQECARYPALRSLEDNAETLAHCIQRDIRRIFTDSKTTNIPIDGSGATFPVPSTASCVSQRVLRSSRDITVLCRYALQLLSNLFRFSSLHSLFPRETMRQLFEDVIVIAKSSELCVPYGDGISPLAMWILSTIQLPATYIASSKKLLQDWVHELPFMMSSQPRACDMLHHLLSQYPDLLFHDTIRSLPDILSQLVAIDYQTRMGSAVALAGYALANLSIRSTTSDVPVSETLAVVQKFIRSQLARNRTASAHLLLPDYIARAERDDLVSSDAQGPRWAICVIGCLTILSGDGIFSGTRSFKLLRDTVEQVARNKKAGAIDLVACVWKCLIWAFLQIPSNDTDLGHERRSKKAVAFHLVKQELRGGAGACLIAGLLYKTTRPGASETNPDFALNICWALTALKDLISHVSQDVYDDGLALLGQLASGIGASDASTAVRKVWEPSDIIVKVFFSRHVLKLDVKAFAKVLRDANRFDATIVRPLNESQIIAHWDDLVAIWTIAVERELGTATESFALPDVLIHTWQALLLAQTQLTQERGHLTATPNFTAKAVTTVVHLLEWRPSSEAGPLSPAIREAQRRALQVCARLWAVMRHVFSDSWLSAAAGSLLSSILQHTFDLSDDLVKASWGDLCAHLVSVSAEALMSRLAVADEGHIWVDMRRELWFIAARQWASIERGPRWRVTTEFLAIPLLYWTMDDAEVSLWIVVLDHALTQAQHNSDSPMYVFNDLAMRIFGGSARMRLLETPGIVVESLSRIQITHAVERPPTFLRCLNEFLCDLYSDFPERVAAALRLHIFLRRLVKECAADALLEVLTVLSSGLSRWLADERKLLLVEEYNNAVIPIYCDALRRLRDVPITLEILAALAHFLSSAFVHVPKPGHGPVAFSEFWTHVQPSLKGTRASYPEEIKTALYACRDVFGSSHSEDPSFDTESHSGSQIQNSRAQISPVKSESLTSKSMRPKRHGTQTTPTWNTSPIITSTEVPYDPAAFRQSSQNIPSSSSPLRPVNMDFVSSDSMPSSPTGAPGTRRLAARPPATRVAHERAAKPMDRPLKRRRVDTSPQDAKATDSFREGLPGPSRHLSAHSISPGVQSRKPTVLRTSVRTRTGTPEPDGSQGKHVAPSTHLWSPGKATHALSPSSDDYDAWEAPICDVQERLSDVSDSQPSDAAESDSLLPNFIMKDDRTHNGHGEYGHSRKNTMIIDSDNVPDIPDLPGTRTLSQKRPRPASPVRTRTAPAELEPSHSYPHPHAGTSSPPPARARLGRARTASAQLEELRNVYDALREDGSQLGVGEIAAASALTSRLGAMLSEKLSRRLLRGASESRDGDGASRDGNGDGDEGEAQGSGPSTRTLGGKGQGKGKSRDQ